MNYIDSWPLVRYELHAIDSEFVLFRVEYCVEICYI